MSDNSKRLIIEDESFFQLGFESVVPDDGKTYGLKRGDKKSSAKLVEVTSSEGAQGPVGPQGPAGQGVPAGGTAGQLLSKVDGTDYNTQWKTVTIPSGAQLMTGSKTTIAALEGTEEAAAIATKVNEIITQLQARGIIE